jgi:hypothetical protein
VAENRSGRSHDRGGRHCPPHRLLSPCREDSSTAHRDSVAARVQCDAVVRLSSGLAGQDQFGGSLRVTLIGFPISGWPLMGSRLIPRGGSGLWGPADSGDARLAELRKGYDITQMALARCA